MDPVLFADRYALTGRVREGRLFTELPARDTANGEAVLLWLPHERLLPTPASRARFVADALRLAAEPITGVLPVLDAGDDERAYLSVPEVRRVALPLVQLIDHPAGLPATALSLARRVAPILDFAHERGLTHGFFNLRDVWMQKEQLVLAGFGLWRLFDRQALLETLAAEPCLAPEVRDGAPIAAGTDVYALAATCARICVGGAHWSSVLAQVFPRVWEALSPALALAPGDRPASCATLVTALHEAVAPRRLARGTQPPQAAQGTPAIGTAPGDLLTPVPQPLPTMTVTVSRAPGGPHKLPPPPPPKRKNVFDR